MSIEWPKKVEKSWFWPRFGIIAYAARTRFHFGLDLKLRRGGKGAYKGKSGASQAQPADEKVQAGSRLGLLLRPLKSRNMKIFLVLLPIT